VSKIQKILVVDDIDANLFTLERTLREIDAMIVKAASGNDALAATLEHDFALVILDVQMPVMNGYELAELLSGDPKTMHIPIIFLSAEAIGDMQICSGYKSGAVDYIVKPYNPEILLSKVSVFLELHLHRQELVRQKTLLEDARASAGRLTDCAESMLRMFNPARFDRQTLELKLISQILVGPTINRNRPSGVLVGSPTGGGAFSGRYYYVTSGEVRLFFQKVLVNPPETSDRHFPAPGTEYGNFSSLCTSGQRATILPAVVGDLNNYSAVTIGSNTVVAINYTEEVSRYEVDILKNLSMHLAFFEGLADEVRHTDEAFRYTIESLVRASEANDENTGDHILRVNEYAKLLAMELGLPERLVNAIHTNAQMHDVGKIHISRDILTKPGPLTREEWEVMKQHPLYGAKILGDHPKLIVARNIALTHHECYDGSGYPFGLKGEEVPIEGRIVMMADVYDALRCNRSYKPSFEHGRAVQIITTGDSRTSPARFDPLLLAAFQNRAAEMDFTFNRMAVSPRVNPEYSGLRQIFEPSVQNAAGGQF
jgi:response regulator RpfG family c-di-GMP phosphodiesterase